MRSTVRWLWVPTGLVLFVGAGLLWSQQSRPSDFGWFAYTPLSGAPDVAPLHRLVLVTRTDEIAAVLAVLGLLVLTGGMCYRLGRRRARV